MLLLLQMHPLDPLLHLHLLLQQQVAMRTLVPCPVLPLACGIAVAARLAWAPPQPVAGKYVGK